MDAATAANEKLGGECAEALRQLEAERAEASHRDAEHREERDAILSAAATDQHTLQHELTAARALAQRTRTAAADEQRALSQWCGGLAVRSILVRGLVELARSLLHRWRAV